MKNVKSASLIPLEIIENKILLRRGKKVMIDSDLANLYGVSTKRLNEQFTLRKHPVARGQFLNPNIETRNKS